MSPTPPDYPGLESRIFSITRPHPNLMIEYFFWSLGLLIFFPVALVPLLFKYYTLRYRFDSEGISMSWGFVFRREINLTYARIQDIHVSRGIIERWLGLGSVSIQTASGSSSAEMAIQGLTNYDELRDFLYSRMRGHKRGVVSPPQLSDRVQAISAESSSETLALLRQIHEDLRAVRLALAQRPGETLPKEEERP